MSFGFNNLNTLVSMTTFANFAVDVAAIVKQRNVFDGGCGYGYSGPMFGSGLNLATPAMNISDPSLNLFDPGISSFGADSFLPTAPASSTPSFAPTPPSAVSPGFNQPAFAFPGVDSNYNPSTVPFFPVFSTSSFDSSFTSGLGASSVDLPTSNSFFMDKRSLTKNPNIAPPSSNDIKNLQPQMQNAIQELRRMAQAEGIDFKVTSGHRTEEQQQYLYETLPAGFAAKPGSSQHEKGLAVDISISNQSGAGAKRAKQRLGEIWSQMGYTWGGDWEKNKEDWHFDLRPSNNLARTQYNPFM